MSWPRTQIRAVFLLVRAFGFRALAGISGRRDFRIWDVASLRSGAAIVAPDLEAGTPEVEEEADPVACGLEVGGELGLVDAAEVGRGLQFDDDLAGDQQVEAVGADLHAAVAHGNSDLAFERYSPARQLDVQRRLVDRLEEAGPEFPVHGHGRPDHGPRDLPKNIVVNHHPPREAGPQIRKSLLPEIPANARPLVSSNNGPRPLSFQAQAGFTLLEVMMALLLLATAVTILVQSQTTAVHLQEQATRINTATMLARQIFTELDIRMAKEGFGELEVKEQGDFNDNIYDGAFDDYRWEYEVEKLEVELPNLGNLMGMLGEGTDELGDAAGVSTGGQAPQSDLAALGALGFDFSFLTEQMGKYLREARVRICWVEGKDRSGQDQEECLEVVTHMANPTGRVLSAEEQLALDNYEDAGGDVDALMDQLNGGGGGGNPGAPLGGLGGR